MKRRFYIPILCIGFFLFGVVIDGCSKKNDIDSRLIGMWEVEIPEDTDYSYYHFAFFEDGMWVSEASQKNEEGEFPDLLTTGIGSWKVKDTINKEKINISVTINTSEGSAKNSEGDEWEEYANYKIEFISDNEIEMGEIAMKDSIDEIFSYSSLKEAVVKSLLNGDTKESDKEEKMENMIKYYTVRLKRVSNLE